MKKALLLSLFVVTYLSLSAQVRLDVAGDARILGKFASGNGDNTASGVQSFVGAGSTNEALGQYSFVGGGTVNSAGGYGAFVGGGAYNRVWATSSFIGGGASNTINNSASQSFIAAGQYNTVSEKYSFIGGGYENEVSSSYSFIGGGSHLLARSYAETVFGSYNEDYTPNNATDFDLNDRLFVIGNGTFEGRSNAVTVLKNGKVGIGTSTPDDILEVEGPDNNGTTATVRITSNAHGPQTMLLDGNEIDALYTTLWIQGNVSHDVNLASGGGNVGIGTTAPNSRLSITPATTEPKITLWDSGASHYGFGISAFQMNYHVEDHPAADHVFYRGGKNGDGTELLRIESNGTVLVNGGVVANSSLVNSDEAFKKNINSIKNPLASLEKLNGVSYSYRTKVFPERNFSEGTHLGVIAQEVEKVFPELVFEQNDGYKAVNYDGLIPVLIEGIKEQQNEIEGLEQVVQAQQSQITQQQSQIDELKSLVQQLLEVKNFSQNHQSITLDSAPKLSQNQPNPFNENTLIEYYIPQNTGNAIIQLTSMDGKVLKTVNLADSGAGTLTIKAGTYPSGTYFYSLILDGKAAETKKMILTR